jgi:hypothetical protein
MPARLSDERRSVKSTGSTSSSGVPTRPSAQDEQAAAAFGDKTRRHRELLAAEEIGGDVAEHDRVIRKQLGRFRRIAIGKRRRPRGAGLNDKRVAPFLVLAFADNGIDFESGITL